MKLTYRTRRIFSLLILCIGLPVYIIGAVTIVGLFDRPHMLIELGIYALAGILWAVPFRAVFRGVGAGEEGRSDDGRQ